jgi:molecular chaperone GrpE
MGIGCAMQMSAADEAETLDPKEEPTTVEIEGTEPSPVEENEIVLEDDEVVPEDEPVDELAKWKEMAVRATAELDNFRKRMVREKSNALRYANQSLLEELLPVLDNFEMGLMAAKQDEKSMIFQGMQMVKTQLDAFLSSQGAIEVDAEGAVFDPNVHEAVSQEESSEVEEGTVLRVMRRGYRINDRLLRPAIVVVAKAVTEASDDSQ